MRVVPNDDKLKTLDELSQEESSDLKALMESCHKTISSKVLWNPLFPFNNAVLIELLINMKELLTRLKKVEGGAIEFTDDIYQTGTIKNVTHLILNFRDACCHYSSGRKQLDPSSENKMEVFLNWIYGKSRSNLNGWIIENIYEDDAGIYIGPHILYLKRHLERTFEELKVFLKDVVTEYPDL